MKFTPNQGTSLPESTAENVAISAGAHAYNLAMQNQVTTASTSAASPAPAALEPRDTLMSDSAPDRPASPAIPPGATNSHSPMPPRLGTPSRNLNGESSRAASAHPEPPTMPKEAPPHGAPTRQYLNTKVTGVLLEGMKQLAKEKPKDPLRALGEYLLQKSKELEGTT
ncbi:hypothetical protein B0O99DRAFT_531481 [Bisporella sp. PMI_857]|nr:hypothetical protein B0O99DRAFT_531481 [Bisporella sp. PMI_857]